MKLPLREVALSELVGGGITVNLDGSVTYHDNQTPPTEEAIEAKLKELQADYDSKQYQRDREYPLIGDQLDEIYHKGLTEWKKTIKAVKDKYPKP
jgi:hypothetical protein